MSNYKKYMYGYFRLKQEVEALKQEIEQLSDRVEEQYGDE